MWTMPMTIMPFLIFSFLSNVGDVIVELSAVVELSVTLCNSI
jgi:hypothetical protein